MHSYASQNLVKLCANLRTIPETLYRRFNSLVSDGALTTKEGERPFARPLSAGLLEYSRKAANVVAACRAGNRPANLSSHVKCSVPANRPYSALPRWPLFPGLARRGGFPVAAGAAVVAGGLGRAARLPARRARRAARRVDGRTGDGAFAIVFHSVHVELVPVEVDDALHAGQAGDVRVARKRPGAVRVKLHVHVALLPRRVDGAGKRRPVVEVQVER